MRLPFYKSLITAGVVFLLLKYLTANLAAISEKFELDGTADLVSDVFHCFLTASRRFAACLQ